MRFYLWRYLVPDIWHTFAHSLAAKITTFKKEQNKGELENQNASVTLVDGPIPSIHFKNFRRRLKNCHCSNHAHSSTVSYQTHVLINTTVWTIGAFYSRPELITMTNKPNQEGLGFVSSSFAGLLVGCVISQNVSLRIFICLLFVPSYFLLLLFLSIIKQFVVVKLSKCVKGRDFDFKNCIF